MYGWRTRLTIIPQVLLLFAADRCEAGLTLYNGKIHTMDAKGTVVSSATIREGRFVAGADAGPCARVIDLKGRTVVPGLIDNHNHIVLLGMRPGHDIRIETAASIPEVQSMLKQRAQTVSPGAWITTIGGFHRNQLFPPSQSPRLPTLAELDLAEASLSHRKRWF